MKTIEIKSLTQKTLQFGKENAYPINLEKPFYVNKLKRFYFHDIDTGSAITHSTEEPIISPKQLATITDDNFLKQLIKGVTPKKTNYLEYILGGLIGGFGTGFTMLIIALSMGII